MPGALLARVLARAGVPDDDPHAGLLPHDVSIPSTTGPSDALLGRSDTGTSVSGTGSRAAAALIASMLSSG